SYAQESLWFLDQLAPGNPFYNENANWRVKGPLNVAALHQSVNEIVRRHESLRTTFQTVDGKPVQVIAQTLSLPLPIIDLCDLPKRQRQDKALRLATEEAQQHFDLVSGPLFRTALIRLEEEDHIFLLTMHHIVTDGWSMGLFFQELHALYAAFSLGCP